MKDISRQLTFSIRHIGGYDSAKSHRFWRPLSRPVGVHVWHDAQDCFVAQIWKGGVITRGIAGQLDEDNTRTT